MPVQKNSSTPSQPPTLRGRAAQGRPDARFLDWQRAAFDDGWPGADAPASALPTTLGIDRAKTVISFNRSPDVPFDRSINPYRGCEHGCIYCFARPSHAYLDLSPGLDFETRLFWKPDAPQRLRAELARPGYRCAPLALGVNTDAWQPVERRLGLTRQLLEILLETRHPVSLITKSALVERDLDLLAEMARHNLVHAMISITTLDDQLARAMEPRAARPARRLDTLRRLSQAGVPTGVLFAPLIPALNDHEMEAVLEAAHAAGAQAAGYILMRLPRELGTLFSDWLHSHAPDRARHVLSLLTQMRDGRLNDPRFGHRMRGAGPMAEIYRQRMALLCRRLGLGRMRRELDTSLFRPPAPAGGQGAQAGQLALF